MPFPGMLPSWATKPPLGTGVMSGHPLAQGLRCCFLFNEQAGRVATDLVTGQGAPIRAGSSTPSWLPGGLHFYGTVNGTTPEQVAGDPRDAASTVTAPITMDCVFRLTGNADGGLFGVENNDAETDGGNTKGIGLGIGNGTLDSAGTEIIALNENVQWHATGVTVPTHQWHHVALVFPGFGATAAVYLNGRLIASPGISGAHGGASTAPQRFMVGGYYTSNGGTNRVFTGDIATARYWNRLLTAPEMRRLAAEPYSFLVPA